ncbi:MAG: hypothetical protein R3E79_44200 [Caldilineaceae bacterium]
MRVQSGNVFGVLLHPALAFNLVTIAEIGKGGQAKINADNIVICRQRLLFTLTRKASVPVTNGIALNGQGLNVATDGAVQFHPNITDLGDRQPVTVHLEARLLKGEGIIAAIALKAGYPGSSPFLTRRKNALKARSTRSCTFCKTWE